MLFSQSLGHLQAFLPLIRTMNPESCCFCRQRGRPQPTIQQGMTRRAFLRENFMGLSSILEEGSNPLGELVSPNFWLSWGVVGIYLPTHSGNSGLGGKER